MNTILLGNRPVYDPPGRSLPAVNTFETHCGASRFGWGKFLMTRLDYKAAVATSSGYVELVMASQTVDANGTKEGTGAGAQKLRLNVIIAGCNPVSLDIGDSTRDLVEVVVFDWRYKSTALVSKAYNMVSDAAVSGASAFYATTLNSGAEWTWTEAFTDLAVFPDTSLITIPTTWKPRNLLFGSQPTQKAADLLASKLMLVAGYDYAVGAEALTLHDPGNVSAYNSDLFAAAQGCWLGGNTASRNPKRLPGIVRVTFPAICSGADPYSKLSYEKDYTNSTGDAEYVATVGVGEYVAVWNGSSWTNQTELDAVAADVGARYITQLSAAIGDATYAGIWPFKPDGYIRGIRWISDQYGAKTYLRFNNEADWGAMAPAQLARVQSSGSMPAWDGLGGMRHVVGVGGSSLRPVTLQSDGGGDGGTTPGTAATWTYTVKDYDTGATLTKDAIGTSATGMSPVKPRLPSSASAATAGLAYRKRNGDLVLLEAYESYGDGECA